MRSDPVDLSDGLGNVLWIDLVEAGDEERRRVEFLYRRSLPTADEAEEIEATSRTFEHKSGPHILSFFLTDVDDLPYNTTFAFTVNGGKASTSAGLGLV